MNSVLQNFNFLVTAIACCHGPRAAFLQQPESYPCTVDGIIAYERKQTDAGAVSRVPGGVYARKIHAQKS